MINFWYSGLFWKNKSRMKGGTQWRTKENDGEKKHKPWWNVCKKQEKANHHHHSCIKKGFIISVPSNESQGNPFTGLSSYISQSHLAISSEILLLGKHFIDPSIHSQGAMNHSIVVVCRGQCNGPFRLVHQWFPWSLKTQMSFLMNDCLCTLLQTGFSSTTL